MVIDKQGRIREIIMDMRTKKLSDQLGRMNQGRIAAFNQAIRKGQKVYLDVGCSGGSFAIQYAEKTQRYVLGIDPKEDAVAKFARDLAIIELWQSSPKKKSFQALYENRPNFLFLSITVRQILEENKYSWLRGNIHQVFLNFPVSNDHIEETVALFNRAVTANGELHVLTENAKLQSQIKTQVLIPYRPIAYDAVARTIPTTFSAFMEGTGFDGRKVTSAVGNVYSFAFARILA